MTLTNPSPTEVDCYIYIKDRLKEIGWDVRNPEIVPTGQVYTQNECLSNPEIRKYLNLDKPENIVKIDEESLWVIEAKAKQSLMFQALNDLEKYSGKLNRSKRFKAKFISGVAGNNSESFLVKSFYLVDGEYVPVKINGVEATALLSHDQVKTILDTNNPNIENAEFDLKLFLSKANTINEILHLGAINPHQRANVMAAMLLTTLNESRPDLSSSPSVLISDINARVENILSEQGKGEFVNRIKISMPTTTDNHVKMKKALVDTLQELYDLNIRSAMKSGDDWLGAFYEVFLKYASWAQDLGIVLTPRHITKYAADVMDIKYSDILYDPTCGTGGFLVAGFDYVKQHANNDQVNKFKQYSVFGVEQDDHIAALAVVNMIFRGDGKNNIKDGNCFANFLEKDIIDHFNTAKYVTVQSARPAVTKVMMNPPFSLKRSDEKEYKFVDYALDQMEHGGLLFAILPYPALVKPGGYQDWRRNLLLKHTILCVITLPTDLFYPVGVTTVGIFIRKGIPHSVNNNVLWVRALHDGLVKSKGKRLPDSYEPNDLIATKSVVKAFIHDNSYQVHSVPQFQQASPIDFDDPLLELVPENYLEQSPPSVEEIQEGIDKMIRDAVAYLIQSGQENE